VRRETLTQSINQSIASLRRLLSPCRWS